MKRFIIPLLLPCALHAATIPYENDFSSTGLPVQSSASQWTISGGTYVNTLPMPDSNAVASSTSIQITNASSFSTISLTTQFSIPSVSDVGSSSYRLAGFGFFGTNGSFGGTSSSNPNYLAQFVYAAGASSSTFPKGSLILSNPGDSATGFSTAAGSAIDSGATGVNALLLNTTYILKLDLVLSGGQITMTFGLYDAAGTTQIGTSATATDTTALTGEYFGFVTRAKTGINSGTSQTVNFENFAAVPEPSSVALAFFGLAGFFLVRKFSPRRA